MDPGRAWEGRGLVRILKFVILSVVIALPVFVQAQENKGTPVQRGHQRQTPAKKTIKKEPVKKPPSPLFPKHRRGIYKNGKGVSVIDAAPQSPPLETDDPGVPDKGEYEVNLTTHADFSKDSRAFDFPLVDANYGMLPKIFGRKVPTQVKLEFPLSGAKAPGDVTNRFGIGPTKFGFKFNFFNNERKGVYVALYPQIEFAVPGTDAVEKGLADAGQTLILPLLVQKEFKYLTLVANGGVNLPIHDPARDATGTLSLGFGRAMTPHVAAMADGHFTSTFDLRRERLVVVNVGLMRRLRDTVSLYAKVGRSLFSDEGSAHTYVGAGLKFEFTPKEVGL